MNLSPSELFAQLAWPCKIKCPFCYQKGLPSILKIKQPLSKQEIDTRIKYFSFAANRGLTGRTAYSNDEALNNPDILNLLNAFKKKPPRAPLGIITAGTLLTKDRIRKLAEIKGVYLTLSLNSANPHKRKQFMHDPQPEIAIQSLALLKKYKIPYTVSIIAWPGLSMKDIENTIKHALVYDACLVRISLPSYSKFFSSQNLFNKDRQWRKIAGFCIKMRGKYNIPIDTNVNFYLESFFKQKLDSPYVLGALKNSPAYRAGIKAGDIIIKVDGEKVSGRENTRKSILEKRTIQIRIKRGRHFFTVSLKESNGKYPYFTYSHTWFPLFGLILPQGMHHCDLMQIGDYAQAYNAKNILVLTSEIMKPTVSYLLENLQIEKLYEIKIFLEIPKNEFWGGTINAGDLLTVEDFISAVKQWCGRNFVPDLVIIPFSAFRSSGRDMTGRTFLDIERSINIPVEFIYNEKIVR